MSAYVSVGSSEKIRAEYVRARGRAWAERRLVLFLGAGVVRAEMFEDFPNILRAIPNFGQSARGR